MKLKSEATRAEKELADVAAERSHVMEIQRDSEEARLLHETRMQATISQQTKLIDYLRSASSPPAKSKFRLKKVWYFITADQSWRGQSQASTTTAFYIAFLCVFLHPLTTVVCCIIHMFLLLCI